MENLLVLILIEPKKFLFLEPEAIHYNEHQLFRRKQTVFKRYLEQLKEAAQQCNIKIATHDIRRSVAELVRVSTHDPFIVQKVLDHSSLEVTERYLKDSSEEVAGVMLGFQQGF